MCTVVEGKVEVKSEGVAAEVHEQLKDVQSLLASGGSGDLASWVRRVQGLEANFHSGMGTINLRVAQLEHEINVAKSKAVKKTEKADGASRREPTVAVGEADRQGTEEWKAGEHSARSVPERFAAEVQQCRRNIRRFVDLELDRAAMELSRQRARAGCSG